MPGKTTVLEKTILKCDVCGKDAIVFELKKTTYTKKELPDYFKGEGWNIELERNDGTKNLFYAHDKKELEEILKNLRFFLENVKTTNGRTNILKKAEQPIVANPHPIRIGSLINDQGFWCTQCNKIYCEKEWKDQEEKWDDGFFDCVMATCPAGHRTMISD